jgi:hypothetical protein
MARRLAPSLLLAVFLLASCDFSGRVSLVADGGIPSADAGDVLDGGAGPPDGSSPTPDAGVDGGPVVSCEGVECALGQRCDTSGGTPACVNVTCEEADCDPVTERCDTGPTGGAYCFDLSCEADVDCLPEEFCSAGGVCTADVCVPGTLVCDGTTGVLQCASNGSGQESQTTCGSESAFLSECEDDGEGNAGCSCEGDWDCPANTVCEVGVCVGTGRAPTCTLPPVPFDEALPAVEIFWGGDSRDDDDASDGNGNVAPYPRFSHVLNTPIVANLDDDNADGLINELDFPEILFVGHQGNNPWANGVLRAIHGGGLNRGGDYFARCGDDLWSEGDPDTTPTDCGDNEPDADSGAPVAVGDLDYDGVPEIVYPREGNRFRILDNRGELLFDLPSGLAYPGGDGETVSLANLDRTGNVEIIVGDVVYLMDKDEGGDWRVRQRFAGSAGDGRNDNVSRMACAADVVPGRPGLELAAGASLYALPSPLPACDAPPCTESLDLLWDAPSVGTDQSGRLSGEGFCAIADVWGADPLQPPGPDNPLDGSPEIILIDNGDLTILDAATGVIIDDRDLGGGRRGGAPNVDDFDGDGFPEIASALEDFYTVVDLQAPVAGFCPAWTSALAFDPGPGDNPNLLSDPRDPGSTCSADGDCNDGAVCNRTLGQCTCLHNGWFRESDDDSSRATSSSVFDFNGDGAAEVLYNDECFFRVYDGRDGAILFSQVNRSRTGIENPVVADIDNDGNAEVVAGANTAQGNRCDLDGGSPIGPNGIRVWGDPNDSWVSARRVWNEQSYHVVNVTERGGIPVASPDSWGSFNGRTYNTYRSQPRSFGVAPDVVIAAVGVSSPDAQCGSLSDTLEITFEVRNEGDLRVGRIPLGFVGLFGAEEETLLDDEGMPLELTLESSLEPGRSVFLSVTYQRTNSARGVLPDRIRVVADPTSESAPFGAERECREGNNALEADVVGGDLRADLVIEVGETAPNCDLSQIAVPITVRNQGTADADSVDLRFYAGDPALGGMALFSTVLDMPLAAGASRTLTIDVPGFPDGREIRIFAAVDPDNTVSECNDANNVGGATNLAICEFEGPF